MRRDAFQAIADPNRREIMELLAKKTLTLNGVALHFDISRPAISKHIKILAECGLIKVTQDGRERYCQANLKMLKDVFKWTAQFQHAWTPKQEKATEVLPADKKGKKKKGKKKKK